MRKRPRIILELNCFVEVPLCFLWALLHLMLSDSFCPAVMSWGKLSFHHSLHADQEKLQWPGILLAACQVKTVQMSGILTVIYNKVNLNRTQPKNPLRWKWIWHLLRGSLRSTGFWLHSFQKGHLGVFNQWCQILIWSEQAVCYGNERKAQV